MSEAQKWNRDRTETLLRYGRKHSGPWDLDGRDDAAWREGEIPDDCDVDLIIDAPALLDALRRLHQAVKTIAPGYADVEFEYVRAAELLRKHGG